MNKKGQALAEVHGFVYALSILLALVVFFTSAFYVLGESSTSTLNSAAKSVDANYVLLDLMGSSLDFNGEEMNAQILFAEAIYHREKFGDVASETLPYNNAIYDDLYDYFEGSEYKWRLRLWKFAEDDYLLRDDYFGLKFMFQHDGWHYDVNRDSRAYIQLPYEGQEGYKYFVMLELRRDE